MTKTTFVVALSLATAGCQPLPELDEPPDVGDTEVSGSTFEPWTDDNDGSTGMPQPPGACVPGSTLAGVSRPQQLAGVEVVEGSLLLDDITGEDLGFLRCLRRVDGDLRIWDSPRLRTIEGLARLESVHGLLEVRFTNVRSIEGLTALREVDVVQIWDNPALESVGGLSGLRTVGDFGIAGSPKLQRLALPSVETIGRFALSGVDGLTELDLRSLTSARSVGLKKVGVAELHGLAALERVEGSLSIDGLAALESVDGLASLTTVSETLTIEHIPRLGVLEFPALVSVADLRVQDDETLTRIELPALERLGALSLARLSVLVGVSDLTQAEGLTELSAYELPGMTTLEWARLEPVADRIYIGDAPTLVDVAALDAVVRSRQHVTLTGLPSLASLQDLDALTTVDGSLGLVALPSVEDLAPLGALESVGAGSGFPGGMRLSRMDGLTDLSGLDGLDAVDGDLVIESNASLQTLAGLDGLKRVEGAVRIAGNPQLLVLDGLGGLETIAGGLAVADNAALHGLDAIWPIPTGVLQTVGEPQLTISTNPALSQCTVDAFVDALIAAGWLALTDVAGNGPC